MSLHLWDRQVQKAFIWCIVMLRCLVLHIFSSGLKTTVSARHITFFLHLAPTAVFWTRTSAGTPHWGSFIIILGRELLQGIYQLVVSSTCLTRTVSKHLYGSHSNSQLECCTPTSTHLQCLIPSAPIMMCPSGCWEYLNKTCWDIIFTFTGYIFM